jgi:hypothetical protein
MRFSSRFPRLVAFAGSLLIPIPSYIAIIALWDRGIVRGGVIVLVLLFGGLLGAAASASSRSITRGGIAAWATAGLGIPWLALVVLTSGFALISAPLLLIYGSMVFWGATVGRKRFDEPKLPEAGHGLRP